MPSKGEDFMHDQEVRKVVAEVLAEQQRLHADHLDDVVIEVARLQQRRFVAEPAALITWDAITRLALRLRCALHSASR